MWAHPSSLKITKHKAVGFLSNTGPDPIENLSQHSVLSHIIGTSETTFNGVSLAAGDGSAPHQIKCTAFGEQICIFMGLKKEQYGSMADPEGGQGVWTHPSPLKITKYKAVGYL